jgi:hypothetical protein
VRFGYRKLRATDRDQQTVFVTTPRLLGYWRLELPETDPDEWYRNQLLQWPDVTLLVDPDWREDERRRVGEYLQRGTRVNQMRGLSLCRFCERRNGSAELADGVYCWPEGLAHYVSEHDVRLPEEFVAHVLSQPPRRWFTRLPRWKRRRYEEIYVEVDPSWWRQVTEMRGNG